MPETKWTGRTVWYRRQTVEVISEPDSKDRVCISTLDDSLKVVDCASLEPVPSAQFKCWWQGNKTRSFVIRKHDIGGQATAVMTIPESLLPNIIALMKGNKTARDSELWAKDHPANELDPVDKVTYD